MRSFCCLAFLFLIIANPARAESNINHSSKIDELVAAKLKEQGFKPNGEITDEVFLRRVYLGIAGRIPTIEEAESFQADTYSKKRDLVIDRLFEGEGYVSHFYHFWADLLRINGRPGGVVSDAYELWVKNSIRENKPYDQMVYELVTADGKFWDNGAIGYYYRDRGMPLDNMSNTVRIFLGTRLECAQCHNHPFDKWTQMDYFKMASFSYGVNTRNYDTENRNLVTKHYKEAGLAAYQAKAKELSGLDDFPYFNERSLSRYIEMEPEARGIASVDPDKLPTDEKARARFLRKLKGRSTRHEKLGMTKDEFVDIASQAIEASESVSTIQDNVRETLGELYNPLQYVSISQMDRDAPLPHDYQYSDASPKDKIAPATMFGAEIDLESTDESRIEAYGKWMTSSDNPRFTQVIVNRLWKEAFGLGIFEPVDELADHTYISNPELLDYLVDLMVELDYDTREFQKILYKTATYQRAAFQGENVMGAPFYFEGPTLKRLSAEQIWDSLVTLALPGADQYQPRLKSQLSGIDRVKRIYRSLEERPFDEFLAMVEEIAPIVAERRRLDAERREQLIELRESGDEEGYRRLRQEIGRSKREMTKKISDIAYVHLREKVDGSDLLLAMGVVDMGMSMAGDEGRSAGRVIMTKLAKPEMKQLSQQLAEQSDSKEDMRQRKRELASDYNGYRNLISGMARASELQSPARPGHFLRDFGQSDREMIENASAHASVPQALNLLNGPMVESLTNRFSVFGKRLHDAGSPEEKARMIFQGMLSRQPTPQEIELVTAEVEAHGDKAYEGIVWALLNTRQFMFVQ